jgi:hypothetical protein
MSRNIRDRRDPNKRVVHITNRCWEGLPFVPNHFIRRLLNGVMARAQTLHPVSIICYVFMGNHYHIIIAGDANRVSNFANYLDGEIAKRMMRIFPGRWGSKFWTGRFKEQFLPTTEAVIQKIAYVFCNPLRARLVSDLQSYPGASSISALNSQGNKTSNLHSFTFPRHFAPLKNGYISRRLDLQLCKHLQNKSTGFCELSTDLFAWTKCFRDKIDRKATLARIEAQISEQSLKTRNEGFIGAKNLSSRPLDRPHRPEKKRTDRTPFVDCPDPEARILYIADYRAFQRQARDSWKAVKKGYITAWPLGSFCPSRRWLQLKDPEKLLPAKRA